MINTKNLEKFILQFPIFIKTAEKLNKARIDWMIGGSGCLFLLGSERTPNDIDIFLPDNQHDKADELFNIKSYIHTSPAVLARNSNPSGDHSIQLTSHLEFNFDKHYEFGVTDAVINKRIKCAYNDTPIYLLPPEDVLLIKALLQRGREEGKNDIEDIKNFMTIYDIDHDYLYDRIKELGAERRIGDTFK